MEFSDRLKSLRLQAEMTQAELAEKLSVTRQAVSNYEQGRSFPSLDVLAEIGRIFDVSLDELLAGRSYRMQFLYPLLSACAIFMISVALAFSCAWNPDPKLLYPLFLVLTTLIPFLCTLMYLLFWLCPPKKINRIAGYRTKASMKNQLAWDFAQAYFSRVLAKLSLILYALSLIFVLLTFFVDLSVLSILGLILFCMQTFSLFVPVFFVEKKLKIFIKRES